MPSAARSVADSLVLFSADVITDAVRSQISTGLCSTQPAFGRICSCSSWWRPTSAPSWSKIMHRVLVVPWSMAAMNSRISANLAAPLLTAFQSSMMDYMASPIDRH